MTTFGGNGLRGRRRAFIALTCAVVVLSILVSSAFIAREAVCHHRCVGEDCPVCRFIAQIEQLRRGFGLTLMALTAICFGLLACGHVFGRAAAEAVPARYTPVGRKTRMND